MLTMRTSENREALIEQLLFVLHLLLYLIVSFNKMKNDDFDILLSISLLRLTMCLCVCQNIFIIIMEHYLLIPNK